MCELGSASRGEWHTPALGDVVTRVFFHWQALVLRAVCRRGSSRYSNVSIEGLLEDISRNAGAFLAVARQEQVRRWLKTATV
jgi:hypothetical protein